MTSHLSGVLMLFVCWTWSMTIHAKHLTIDSQHLSTPIEMRKSPALEVHRLSAFNKGFESTVQNPTRTLQFLPDSIVVYSVQSNPLLYKYSFSNKGELLSTLVLMRQGASWINQSLETRTYDAMSNMTIQHWQSWNGTAWTHNSRKLFTYDNNHQILSLTEQNWNASLNSWVNLRRTTHTWSSSGHHLTMLQEVNAGDAWINQTFEFYIWENNQLVQAVRQIWSSNNWVNDYHYSYTYDAENNLTSMTMKQWASNQWNDYYKEFFSYNASNQLIFYISQLFNGNWLNSEQYFYTYDPLGFPESVHRQVWQTGSWQNSLLRTFTNDNFGIAQYALYQIWEQSSWLNQNMFTKAIDENGNTTLSNAYKWSGGWLQNEDHQLEINYNFGLKTLRFIGYIAEATFSSMIVGNDDNPTMPQLHVFPNPSNGRISIFNKSLNSESVRLSIFITDGRDIFHENQPVGNPIILDLHNIGLKKGSYILKVTTPTKTLYKHIVLN